MLRVETFAVAAALGCLDAAARATRQNFLGGFEYQGIDALTEADQQDLLARAIPVDDEASFLGQLEDVRAMVASGYELTLLPLLARGRRVRVVGGPLHGLEGFVDDPTNPQGVVLSVDVLQQGLLVKVPAEHLQAMP